METPGQIGKLPKDRDSTGSTGEPLVSAALQISPWNKKGLREQCLKKNTGLKNVGLKKKRLGKLQANMRNMRQNKKYAEEMITGIVNGMARPPVGL